MAAAESMFFPPLTIFKSCFSASNMPCLLSSIFATGGGSTPPVRLAKRSLMRVMSAVTSYPQAVFVRQEGEVILLADDVYYCFRAC